MDPAAISALYERYAIETTREAPADGKGTLVHLVEEGGALGTDCHHSAVRLGSIDEHEICLWKDGNEGRVLLTTGYEMRRRYEQVVGRMLAPLYVDPARIKAAARAPDP